MKFSEKLALLRIQNGLSQEELAEKLSVSRQTISKWESGQCAPELSQILDMSVLFSVSTDVLLKEDLSISPVFTVAMEEKSKKVAKVVSLTTATEYLDIAHKNALWIGLGVFLCILSPVFLIILAGAQSSELLFLTEETVTAFGLPILLLHVAIAVAFLISAGFKEKPYEFLNTESFAVEDEVVALVKERQDSSRKGFHTLMICGLVLCILSPAPIFLGMVFENEFLMVLDVAFLLFMVGVAVFCFIYGGVVWSSYQKLLKEGIYTDEKKAQNKKNAPFTSMYWLLATTIYLLWSFWTEEWSKTWMVWPIAALFFPLCIALKNMFTKEK